MEIKKAKEIIKFYFAPRYADKFIKSHTEKELVFCAKSMVKRDHYRIW